MRSAQLRGCIELLITWAGLRLKTIELLSVGTMFEPLLLMMFLSSEGLGLPEALSRSAEMAYASKNTDKNLVYITQSRQTLRTHVRVCTSLEQGKTAGYNSVQRMLLPAIGAHARCLSRCNVR